MTRTSMLHRAAAATSCAVLVTVAAACGDSDDTAPTTTAASPSSSIETTTPAPGGAGTAPATPPVSNRIEVRLQAGNVTPAPSRHRVELGDVVTLVVTSDITEEVHVHGYDNTADLVPGTPATITFTANIPGVFEVELEGSHRKLLDLEVRG